MRYCRKCCAEFEPTANQLRKQDYLCPPCRLKYDHAWRAKRRSAGLPSSGSDTWAPEKREAWKKRYYKRRDVRARKAADARKRSKDPVEAHKIRARLDLRNAVRRGEVVKPDLCQRCSAPKPHGHHPDYSKPLEVLWLCRVCHVAEHSKAEGR